MYIYRDAGVQEKLFKTGSGALYNIVLSTNVWESVCPCGMGNYTNMLVQT